MHVSAGPPSSACSAWPLALLTQRLTKRPQHGYHTPNATPERRQPVLPGHPERPIGKFEHNRFTARRCQHRQFVSGSAPADPVWGGASPPVMRCHVHGQLLGQISTSRLARSEVQRRAQCAPDHGQFDEAPFALACAVHDSRGQDPVRHCIVHAIVESESTEP
ncbi:hypothetical protein BC628DRAFT_1350907 [Trametes gibbosa]|nr:hypothetical protein BC628DRAFT_1350907 [Trametes gibbosa]